MKAIKHLNLIGAHNVRDLGGYMINQNHISAWHTLYRGDNLHTLVDQDWTCLYQAKIRTIIDLRSLAEVENEGYDSEAHLIKTYHIPLQNEQIDMHNLNQSLSTSSFLMSLTDGYRKSIENNQANIAKIMNTIGEHIQDGAILFHCTAGKDRTGVISFILLSLIGVQNEDIIADYEVSASYIHKGIGTNQLLSKIPEKYQYLLHSDPSNLDGLFDYFSTKSVESYLLDCGVSQQHIDNIKNCFID
ncbi:MAG: tyrosine-protein phosphatase [Erysipelotrichaceae bacterium]